MVTYAINYSHKHTQSCLHEILCSQLFYWDLMLAADLVAILYFQLPQEDLESQLPSWELMQQSCSHGDP
eukprot:7659872-Karenia_brevis.AAC.1